MVLKYCANSQTAMQSLLIGTWNLGKRAELEALLAGYGVPLLYPEQLGLELQVEETGSDYLANAQLKARGYAQASGHWTIADDTGLEVDALHGKPGALSARFAPTAPERRKKLVGLLRDHPRPWTARFMAVVALAGSRGEFAYGSGSCEGEIIPEERGAGGFGYDPIFLVNGTERTMAELPMAEKNRISHRARALNELLPSLLARLDQPASAG